MNQSVRTIKIGTRGSALALKQTAMVREALAKAVPDLETQVIVIKTSGDWKPSDGEVRLKEADGGKGQFAKEIEEALLSGEIDAAVHSMKDMESFLPEGLEIPFMLPREDAHDALLFRNRDSGYRSIDDLPGGAVIGTASVRRQAFLLARRPDLKVVPLRGNVQTRIDKLRAGQVDATLLAVAGLKRLGLEDEIDLVLSPDDMLPAAAQGAVGIEIKSINKSNLAFFGQISCDQTYKRVQAERAMLKVLDGSCHTPIGAYAVIDGNEMHLRGCVVSLDGKDMFSDSIRGAVAHADDAKNLGQKLGERLKSVLPKGFLDQRIESE